MGAAKGIMDCRALAHANSCLLHNPSNNIGRLDVLFHVLYIIANYLGPYVLNPKHHTLNPNSAPTVGFGGQSHHYQLLLFQLWSAGSAVAKMICKNCPEDPVR